MSPGREPAATYAPADDGEYIVSPSVNDGIADSEPATATLTVRDPVLIGVLSGAEVGQTGESVLVDRNDSSTLRRDRCD